MQQLHTQYHHPSQDHPCCNCRCYCPHILDSQLLQQLFAAVPADSDTNSAKAPNNCAPRLHTNNMYSLLSRITPTSSLAASSPASASASAATYTSGFQPSSHIAPPFYDSAFTPQRNSYSSDVDVHRPAPFRVCNPHHLPYSPPEGVPFGAPYTDYSGGPYSLQATTTTSTITPNTAAQALPTASPSSAAFAPYFCTPLAAPIPLAASSKRAAAAPLRAHPGHHQQQQQQLQQQQQQQTTPPPATTMPPQMARRSRGTAGQRKRNRAAVKVSPSLSVPMTCLAHDIIDIDALPPALRRMQHGAMARFGLLPSSVISSVSATATTTISSSVPSSELGAAESPTVNPPPLQSPSDSSASSRIELDWDTLDDTDCSWLLLFEDTDLDEYVSSTGSPPAPPVSPAIDTEGTKATTAAATHDATNNEDLFCRPPVWDVVVRSAPLRPP